MLTKTALYPSTTSSCSSRCGRKPVLPDVERMESRLLSSATAIQSGQTIAGVIAVAGQKDTYTFTASAGNSFEATLADSDAASQFEPQLQLFGPDGTLLKNSLSSGTDTSISTGVYTVPATGPGTYTLVVQNDSVGVPSTGGYNLELAQRAAVQAVDPNGDGGTMPAVRLAPGRSIAWGTWTSTRSRRRPGTHLRRRWRIPMPQASSSRNCNCSVPMEHCSRTPSAAEPIRRSAPASTPCRRPARARIRWWCRTTASGSRAPAATTWNWPRSPAVQAVDPNGDGGTIASGQTRSGSINRLGNMDIYTFAASAGNSFEATLADSDAASQFEPQLQLFGPDGTLLKNSLSSGTDTSISTGVYTVPATGPGTYTLVVQNDSVGVPSTGGYNLELAQARPCRPWIQMAMGNHSQRSDSLRVDQSPGEHGHLHVRGVGRELI